MEYNIMVNVKYKTVIQTNYDFKQQDYGQKLIVTAEDYDITGTTARLFINKRDDTIIERIMIKENNSYTYTLDAQDTSCAGKTVCDIKYYKDGVRDSSASFTFNIIYDRSGKLIESEDFSDSISAAIERCDQAVANIQAQANKAIEDVENALLAELNIYDGYDKTTVGFAADARQLNENVADTYAAKIKAKFDAVNNNLESISKVNKSSNTANPATTGHSSLLDYVTKDLIPSGLGYYCFSASAFSDLPTTDWGYTCEYVNSGGAVFVRLYKHLSAHEMCVRALSIDGTWVEDWRYLSFT